VDITHRIEQNHGDIILMTGNIQQEWKHGINKSKKITLPRINLTFRTIITR
jgi:alkylated DNA repair dioxygenase AlkB